MSTNTTDGPDDRPIRHERHADLMSAHEHDEEQDRLAGYQVSVADNEPRLREELRTAIRAWGQRPLTPSVARTSNEDQLIDVILEALTPQPAADSEPDVIIEAAIDEFFATDFAEGIDWVGTGAFPPSEEQQRAEVRTVVEAVLAPALTLLAEQVATIERVRGLCAVMVRQHHSDWVQVSDVMRELDTLGSQQLAANGGPQAR